MAKTEDKDLNEASKLEVIDNAKAVSLLEEGKKITRNELGTGYLHKNNGVIYKNTFGTDEKYEFSDSDLKADNFKVIS